MLAAHKEIVRRFTEEVWGQGDMAAADEVLAADLIDHSPQPGQGAGREGHKQVVTAFRSAFPDLHVTAEDLVAEGDKVALRWQAEGTHQGELMGIAPTGRRVTMRGIEMLRIGGGQIRERWAEDNALNVLQQLGVLPAPAE